MEKKNSQYSYTEDLEKTLEEQSRKLEELRSQLEEANETIEAIRSGQIDALVVQGEDGHQLYTLRSADQTYRVFIEKMTEGAVTLNRLGTIVFSNTQFASMVNMPLSNVIGLPFSQFVSPENIHQYEKLFKSAWNADCKGEANLLSGQQKTPVQLSLTTLELAEGLSLSIIITDLSFQKDIQEQLKKNNRQLEA
ncbi:MAG: PAS domain-containing sensor histidine kinase, partial [Flavisolibacter sp.]